MVFYQPANVPPAKAGPVLMHLVAYTMAKAQTLGIVVALYKTVMESVIIALTAITKPAINRADH